MTTYQPNPSTLTQLFFYDTKSAPIWLLIRLYVGYEWMLGGWEKINDTTWYGEKAGTALNGFIQGALHKTAAFCPPAPAACYPDVSNWYAAFLQNIVLPHVTGWSYAITLGELAVGLGLIVGLFTGLAAFFGLFMNLNFMLAGALSINPQMFVLALGIVLARRVAGYYGLDHYGASYIRRYSIGRALSWT
jgi:thiosulfate dehydrogenase [quinone] large subunit